MEFDECMDFLYNNGKVVFDEDVITVFDKLIGQLQIDIETLEMITTGNSTEVMLIQKISDTIDEIEIIMDD